MRLEHERLLAQLGVAQVRVIDDSCSRVIELRCGDTVCFAASTQSPLHNSTCNSFMRQFHVIRGSTVVAAHSAAATVLTVQTTDTSAVWCAVQLVMMCGAGADNATGI